MDKTQYVKKFNDYIHYLCHIDTGTLVYPKQTEESYSSYGSFYIIGESIQNNYILHTMDKGNLIELSLLRDELNPRFFVINHSEYGRFYFHEENIKHWNLKLNYRNVKHTAIRRLRPWNEHKLELICKDKDFYFVGFADLVDGQELR